MLWACGTMAGMAARGAVVVVEDADAVGGDEPPRVDDGCGALDRRHELSLEHVPVQALARRELVTGGRRAALYVELALPAGPGATNQIDGVAAPPSIDCVMLTLLRSGRRLTIRSRIISRLLKARIRP